MGVHKLWLLVIVFFGPMPFCSVLAQQAPPPSDFGSVFANSIEPDVAESVEVETDASSESLWSALELTGYLKNEIAYRIREPRAITKLRNIAYLNSKYPLTDNVKFNFTGWAYYDHAYDMFNYETISARLERNSEEPLAFVENLPQEKDTPVAAIRELYLDVAANNWDMRLGKQYIVWGVLEGVRIVDEMNPMDFRELILPDLLDYRISLWSAKLDYYTKRGDLQFVWIPDLQFHKPAPPGSEWELLQEVPGTRRPESWRLENSEVGMRWSADVADTELSLSYFYTWDDFPVVFRSVKIGGETPIFYPTYSRLSIFGATAVRQMGGYILKGELAYVRDKFFGLSNVADADGDGYVDSNGEVQKNHIRWGGGVDVNLLGWDVALGGMQWIILDYEKSIIQKQVDTSFNMFVRREFPAYSMTVQALWIYLQTMNESFLKPKVTFHVTNRFQVAVGMDIFEGPKSDFGTSNINEQGQFNPAIQQAQFVGNFHDNDRVFFEFKYSF